MNTAELTAVLLDELGYNESSGLKSCESLPSDQKIPDIESVYSVKGIPVAYFSRLASADPNTLWQLHRRVWNESRVPLLYVVLPYEIRIYNTYALPTQTEEEFNQGDRLLRHLTGLLSLESAREEIGRDFVSYERIKLDTGAFWTTSDGQKIKPQNRADKRLLFSMNQVRHRLVEQGIDSNIAYSLLGRSIFIRYLEDRRILTMELMNRLTNNEISNYREALNSVTATYRLFDAIGNRFNGDLFPVEDKERQVVQQTHLSTIGLFLDGSDLESGQQSFWPFDFQYIPIELISAIYDTFLEDEKRRAAGTYYTPLSLVDFVLDETLPQDLIRPDMTILDPSCGSGVFLVRAFHRLVYAWEHEVQRSASAHELANILCNQIFGVDKELYATRIAAFSLYLAMLRYLGNEEINTQSFSFPKLENVNLLCEDFFAAATREHFRDHKFDRIVGNPPWGENTLTPYAEEWLESNDYTVGDKQIVQAFLLYMPAFCAENGEIAVLAPARSTIAVGGSTHKIFRQRFLEAFKIRAIVNFSALVYELFEDSRSPAVAIFYEPKAASTGYKLLYGTPKPSFFSRNINSIVLDATEIKYLDQSELANNPDLWKIALWGTPRDAALIQRLRCFATLRDQAHLLNWRIHEGVTRGGQHSKKQDALWLKNVPMISAKHFRRYLIDPETMKPIKDVKFTRERTPDIIKAPLALIHQSPIDTRCAAAFSDIDVAYTVSIMGVGGSTGQERLLKWLVAYINSPLVQYYQFLTSTRWAVERGSILQEEYELMPFALLDLEDPRLLRVVEHFDSITDTQKEAGVFVTTEYLKVIRRHEAAIADLVFDIYELTASERQLVYDSINYQIDFFYWSKRARRKPGQANSVQPPDSDMLIRYAQTFVESAGVFLKYQGQALNARVYQDSAPLSVVGFELVGYSTSTPSITVDTSSDSLHAILKKLDKKARQQALFARRHVRIYDGGWLYLIRPSEKRFWTQSQGRADADNALMEWLSQSITREGAIH